MVLLPKERNRNPPKTARHLCWGSIYPASSSRKTKVNLGGACSHKSFWEVLHYNTHQHHMGPQFVPWSFVTFARQRYMIKSWLYVEFGGIYQIKAAYGAGPDPNWWELSFCSVCHCRAISGWRDGSNPISLAWSKKVLMARCCQLLLRPL